MIIRTAVLAMATALLASPTLARAQQPGAEPAQAQAIAAERVARNHHERIAAEIAASGQARDFALASVLRTIALERIGEPPPDDARSREWREAAAARAGADVLANALLMMGAGGADDPIREQAARRWAQAEPGNIAPLLFQDAGVDALLANARGFDRFDMHMYDQVRWIQSRLLRHPPTAHERAVMFDGEGVPVEEHAAISAMGMWAAVAVPSLQDLLQACDGPDLDATATRRADCDYLARVLVGASDSSLGRMLGIDMLGRMASNASERAEAQALQRRMDWQMLEWGRIAAEQPREGAPQFTRLLADPQVRTEHDLVERILSEAGVPLEPPAGWRPPR
ncbi:hypothetical protein BGP89_04500 [Luteimonas sp. JM171]|uniref:hypothetical protein n=1 Tax=Luteimonas sp. JM171 TaxID=1896164 RepID=UPI000856282F|nr:hypothetical protein [Luteimonas sp. JM171]AOH35708.1 hypothetical protein BGP89_04500 [Luteimonas sp. JM171]